MNQSLPRLLIAVLLLRVGGLEAGAVPPEQRIKDLAAPAARGDGPSQLKLALAFDEAGHAVMAARWYGEAARKGYVEAASRLGIMCIKGEGVPQDKTAGVKWFRLAAEHGEPTAQFNLASCYFNGTGVNRNLTHAVQWCLEAAERNLPDAQYLMGVLYGRGEGVTQDYVKSFKWVSMAAAHGHPQARQSLETLMRVMTPEQMVRAREHMHGPGAGTSSGRRE